MLRTVTAATALLAVLAAPQPRAFRFRFIFDAPRELSAETRQVVSAFERGAFVDSLIVRDTTSMTSSAFAFRDNVALAPRLANPAKMIIVRTGLVPNGTNVEVRLQLLDVLARPVAGPDTLRVPIASLDSAVFAQGRRYAQRLAR